MSQSNNPGRKDFAIPVPAHHARHRELWLQATTAKLDPLLGQTMLSEGNDTINDTALVAVSGHCIGSSLGAQSMMRACTRPNLVEWPACPPALTPVKAVEALLQCFGAAKKSMNRKNSESDELRNSGLSRG